MSERPGALPKLGLILPDDPIESEMHRLDRWLSSKGRDDVTALTILSKATGGHFEEDLYATGDLDVIAPVARALAAKSCGAIVWACTSGSFIGGLDWSKQQAAALAEASGVPSSSTTLSFIDAVGAFGAKQVHVLGAYPEPVTRAFMGCLHAAGIEVASWRALNSPDGPSSFRMSLKDEVASFAETLGGGGEEPILIPDTAINSLDLIEALEQSSGRPVLGANQVTLWQGLRMLGVSTALPNAGRLFAGGT